jgi:predicted ATPase
MRIEAMSISNYRVFKDVVFKAIPQISVLVGPNGSGKSTFFDVFGFLKDALTENVYSALAKRGGFREVVSRDSNGPISFHSPEFLNGATLEEIFWLDKKNGFAVVHRARDNELLRNLIREGDKPGALWKQGLFMESLRS